MSSESNQNKTKELKSIELLKKIINIFIIGIGLGVLSGSFLKSIPQKQNMTKSNYIKYRTKDSYLDQLLLIQENNELIKISQAWKKLEESYKDSNDNFLNNQHAQLENSLCILRIAERTLMGIASHAFLLDDSSSGTPGRGTLSKSSSLRISVFRRLPTKAT